MKDRNSNRERGNYLVGRRAGYVLITSAATIIGLLGFIGMGLDVGYFEYQKRKAQTAADAAATGAAQELMRGSDDTAVTAAGRADSASNGFTNGSSGVTVTINHPPTAGSKAGDSNFVEAIVSQPKDTFFMNALGWSSITVKARAVGGLGAADACVWALDTTARDSFTIGGGGNVTLNCGVVVDSSDSRALNLTGGSTMTATSIGITGGYVACCGITPTPVTSVPAEADPVGYMATPSYSTTCDFDTAAHPKTGSNAYHGTYTLSPGTYCGGIEIKAGSNITFNPGLYVLMDFGLQATGGSTLTGNGVSFLNTWDHAHFDSHGCPNKAGSFLAGGGGTVTFTAMTTGSLAGFVWFSRVPACAGLVDTISGGSTTTISGAIYMPYDEVVWGGGGGDTHTWTKIIAAQLSLTGGSTIHGTGTNSIPDPTRHALMVE
jgi:hypothetical protein